MAKIPRLTNKARYNTAVATPTLDARSASLASRAQAQALQSASNSMQQMARVDEARQKAADQDYTREQTLNYSKNVSQYEQQLKMESGGDHKGYADNMKKYMESQQKELLKSAPSENARRELNYRMRSMGVDIYNNASAYENTKRAEYFIGNQQKIVEETGKRYYEDPNADLALKEMPMTLSDLDKESGLTVSPDISKRLKSEYVSGIRNSLVNGLIDKGLYNQAETVLSNPKYAQIREGMDTKELARYSKTLAAKKEQAYNQMVREIAREADNAIAANLSGRGQAPGYKEQILGTMRKVQSLPDGPEKQEMMDSLQKSSIVSEITDQMKNMSASQLSGIEVEDLFEGDLSSIKKDTQFQNSLRTAIANQIQIRESDSSGFIESVDPMMRGPGKVQARVDRAKELGIKEVRGISKQESSIYRQQIEGASTPIGRAKALDDILDNYGPSANIALSDMVKDGLDPSYMIASRFDSPQLKARIIENYTNKKAINEDFNNVVGKGSGINEAVQKKIKDVAAAIRYSFPSDSVNSAMVNSFTSTVDLEAKRLMASEGLGASEAVDKAYQNTIGAQWDIATGNTGRSSKVLVPKGTDIRNVESFMKYYGTSEGLNILGVSAKRFASFAGTDEEFRDYVSENSGFVTNSTQDGVFLRFIDPHGNHYFMTDSTGARIDVKFKDMATQKYQKVLDDRNSLFFSPNSLAQDSRRPTPSRSGRML